MGNGKRYREAAALIDADKEYRPQEAVALLKQTTSANFDETVEDGTDDIGRWQANARRCGFIWMFRGHIEANGFRR